jgi:hypothetical protein
VSILTLHERLLIEAMDAKRARLLIAGSLADRIHGVDIVHRDFDLYVGSDPNNLAAVMLAIDAVDGSGARIYRDMTSIEA